MWGDDFDGRDVLDVQTAAAYKYATVRPSQNENKANKLEWYSSDGKKSHSATFSDVNKKKLVALLRDTGVAPLKRRKKRKQSKAAADTNAVRGVEQSSNSNIATRRIKTANNDDIYKKLDGSIPESMQIVEAFDHANLTHVELFNVGIQRMIPSEPKHNQTYIQGLASVSELVAAGNTFKKQTDLRGSVSLADKQSSTAKAPEWIDLRDNYMRQVRMSAEKIFKSIDSGETNRLGPSTKQHFALLLIAHRKVTLRILSEYEFQREKLQGDQENESLRNNLRSLEEYLVGVPTCLDFINREPFWTWLGVEMLSNPFATVFRLDGTPALLSKLYGSPHHLHPVLEMAEDEVEKCLEMSSLLWRIYQSELHRPRRPFGPKVRSDDGNESNSEEETENKTKAVIYRDEKDDNRIKLLIQRTNSTVHEALNFSRERKVFMLGLAPIKTYWMLWKKSYQNNLKVSEALYSRACRNTRKCFDRLVQNVWQSVKFRSLQQNYHKRIVLITFGAWKEYRLWCARFQNIFRRSVRHILRYRLDLMIKFTKECNGVRSFYRKNKARIYAQVFKALVNNTKLSKFLLKKRLERKSTISFYDRFLCQCSFSRWTQRGQVIAKLDKLEEFVESIELKQALVKWVLFAYGPRSQRRARSISKAKQFILDLRDSFEKRASTTYRYISESLAAYSPLPTAKEQHELEQKRYEGGEHKRKLRIKQALEYAKNAYNKADDTPVKLTPNEEAKSKKSSHRVSKISK